MHIFFLSAPISPSHFRDGNGQMFSVKFPLRAGVVLCNFLLLSLIGKMVATIDQTEPRINEVS
jgi:hypothetical protein